MSMKTAWTTCDTVSKMKEEEVEEEKRQGKKKGKKEKDGETARLLKHLPLQAQGPQLDSRTQEECQARHHIIVFYFFFF